MPNSKITRLLGTLLLLRSKEWVSSRDLAQRFDVSLRTVYRDIEMLQKHGIPIQGVPGPEGGYRLETEGPLDPLLFSNDQALSLYLLGAGGSSLPDSIEQRAEKVIGRLEDVIRPEDASLLRRASARIFFDTSDWYWRDEASGWIPLLRQAVFEEQEVFLDYKHRGSDDVEAIHVAPYGLVWKGGEWYLVGKTAERESIERFRVSRITKAALNGSPFSYPRKFDLQKWWTNELERFGKGEIRVRLVVQNEARAEILRLATKDNSDITHQDDVTYVTLYVDRWDWLVPLILSYAGSVYVEEPRQLRQSVIDSLIKGLRWYTNEPASRNKKFVNDDSRLRATRGRVI